MVIIKYNKYTNIEINKLLDEIVILIDTREQKNKHITNYLEDKKLNYESMKLDFSDYTCMLPKNEELGITRDIYLNNTISIERKANLEELSNNFTKDRSRIETEFIRARGKQILLIENATYEDIVLHRYKTKYNPKSFIATLNSFKARYDIETIFIDENFTGNYIYHCMKYHVRDLLKYGTLGKAI